MAEDKAGKSKKSGKGLAAKKEVVDKVKKLAGEYLLRFEADRKDFDDKAKVNDGMYAAMQNRSLLSSEKEKGMNMAHDTRANVGSPLYYRMINAMAAQLYGVMRSRPDLAKYDVQSTEGIPESSEDSADRAAQLQALMRWTLKKDDFDTKLPEFTISVYKDANIYALVTQKRTLRRHLCVEPVYGPVQAEGGGVVVDAETGEPKIGVIGEQRYWETKVIDNHPSFSFPHPSNVYADRFAPTPNGSMQSHNCVFLTTPRSLSEIYGDKQQGFFDEEAVKSLKDVAKWDGQYGNVQQEEERKNREEATTTPSDSDLYLQWDYWIRLQMGENGEWDDEAPPELYWVTAIGNTVQEAVVVRFERNPDPDDEIPLQAIRAIPDRKNELLHTTPGEIVRSLYSTSCTLWNQELDYCGNVIEPKLVVVDGEHRIKDFTLGDKKPWHVFSKDAVTPFPMANATFQTAPLLEKCEDAMEKALTVDPALMGQYAGSRTPATEFLGVNQNTGKIHFMFIGYIISQLVPWMYRKGPSYWKAFGLPNQVLQIADADKIYEIRPREIAADFDVIVNVLDDYIDNMEKAQTDREFMQMMMAAPQLLQSDKYTFEPLGWLQDWAERRKYNISKFILPNTNADATELATVRINQMLNDGIYIRPNVGENLLTHLRVAKAERVRWRGNEDSPDQRARNLPMLDQYIAELQVLIENQRQQSAGSPPNMPSPRTAGQAQGQEMIAGNLGAMLGG